MTSVSLPPWAGARLHPRKAVGAAKRQPTQPRGDGRMNPLKQLEACGQSPWLDYLKRSLIATGGLRDLVEQRRPQGCYLEPFDLREGHRRDRGVLGRSEAVPGRGGPRHNRDLRASGDRRHPRWRRRVAPGLRSDPRPGWLYQPRVLALPGQRHRRHGGRGCAAMGGGGSSQSDGEGAGHPGRHSRHPSIDRARAQHQHHAALRASTSTSRW